LPDKDKPAEECGEEFGPHESSLTKRSGEIGKRINSNESALPPAFKSGDVLERLATETATATRLGGKSRRDVVLIAETVHRQNNGH
jgi:hypothetical protein